MDRKDIVRKFKGLHSSKPVKTPHLTQHQQPVNVTQIQRAVDDPLTMMPEVAQMLQSTHGNHFVNGLVGQRMPIQAKRTVTPAGDKYEQEADQVASQVVGQLNSDEVQRGAADTIQRVMSIEDFKVATSHKFHKRKKIKTVDDELTAYHALDTNNRNYTALKNQLDVLARTCSQFLADKPDTARRAGVITLLKQIVEEKKVITPLALFQAETNDRVARFNHLLDAQTAYLRIQDYKYFARPGISTEISGFLLNESSEYTWNRHPEVVKTLVEQDIEKLKTVRDANDTPPTVRAYLTEILNPENLSQLHYEMGGPGAKYTTEAFKEKANNKKYRLTHSLDQPGGEKERLGSLAHELTHISVAETYENSHLLLAFGSNTSDETILKMHEQRKANLEQVQELVKTNAGGTFSSGQVNMVVKKANYPKEGKITKYLEQFKPLIGEELHDHILALVNSDHLDATIIEYDTVINQMTLWMHLWSVSLDNPTYAYLLELAKDAYMERALYRNMKV
ncbi:hypothetical protein ACFLYO_05610 [Chloroflexota bacterium]